jgi:hypothetical protein
MKIRIKGNSLRYRLTKSEVDHFVSAGCVEEKINFGNSILYYSLKKSVQNQLSASFNNNEITLYFPSSFINEWINSEQIGFEYNMEVEGSDKPLYLLVEKDFTCLDKTNEDQSDNYPNPLLKNLHEHT